VNRVELKGGNETFVEFLDQHFDGGSHGLEVSIAFYSQLFFIGHNDHTNEPSHHIPYLYALAGAPSKGQARIRSIASADYNATADGLAGVWPFPLAFCQFLMGFRRTKTADK
jgi:putative alpha-1,2-mannosidase